MRLRVLFAGTALGCLAPLASVQADTSLEYAVKAAYLPKFVPFITWPDAAFTSPTQPVTICVLGNDPFGGKLQESAGAARSGERAIVVRRLAAPDPNAVCQLLFLSGDAAIAEGTWTP